GRQLDLPADQGSRAAEGGLQAAARSRRLVEEEDLFRAGDVGDVRVPRQRAGSAETARSAGRAVGDVEGHACEARHRLAGDGPLPARAADRDVEGARERGDEAELRDV